MIYGALALGVAVAAGLWVARDRHPIPALAQPSDPAVELPDGWDLPPPTTNEPISSRSLTPALVKELEARNAGRMLRWRFRVELPVKESRCLSKGSSPAFDSCAKAPDGEERVASAVITRSRTLIHALGGTFERDRLFYLKGAGLNGGDGYFHFVRVKRDWVRVSHPMQDVPALNVTITPPATSLRSIAGHLAKTSALSPPTLSRERALSRARRWLDSESPLTVELIAVPQSWRDSRVTRLCYLVRDEKSQARLWIDAHSGHPYLGGCAECSDVVRERLERLVEQSPDAFEPPKDPREAHPDIRPRRRRR